MYNELEDPVFVDDVLYLYDMGETISKIAYIMGCDEVTVDQIICREISKDTSDYLELL